MFLEEDDLFFAPPLAAALSVAEAVLAVAEAYSPAAGMVLSPRSAEADLGDKTIPACWFAKAADRGDMSEDTTAAGARLGALMLNESHRLLGLLGLLPILLVVPPMDWFGASTC